MGCLMLPKDTHPTYDIFNEGPHCEEIASFKRSSFQREPLNVPDLSFSFCFESRFFRYAMRCNGVWYDEEGPHLGEDVLPH